MSLKTVWSYWVAFCDWLAHDAFGGPRIPMYYAVNLQKCGTLPFVLILMFVYRNFTTTAFVYAALHGSYGLIWFLKHLVFRDRSFDTPVTYGAFVFSWILVLGPYWVSPCLIVSNRIEAGPFRIFSAIVMYAIGVILMVGADVQKHFVLRVKRGLITDGFFSMCRHPNYLGEMMLYASFAMLAKGQIWSWAVLLIVWSSLFVRNIWGKETSMSRYDEWAEYCEEVDMIIPLKWVKRMVTGRKAYSEV